VAIAEADGRVKHGDFRGAIICYERAITYWLDHDCLLQAVSAMRQIFSLDMLKSGVGKRLGGLLATLATEDLAEPWLAHEEVVADIREMWPYRTATVMLAAVGFQDEETGFTGELAYIEGRDPIVSLCLVTQNLMRIVKESAFDYVSDVMIVSMLASALIHQGQFAGSEEDTLELELRSGEQVRSFLLYGSGEWAPLTQSNTCPWAAQDKNTALLLEADLCLSLGMGDNARMKYNAVLANEPNNKRALNGLQKLSSASR
jgi:hypothetical protein